MKRFVYTFLLFSLFFGLLGPSALHAQRRYDLPVTFELKRLAWNDTMMFMTLDFRVQEGAEVPSSLADFSGTARWGGCNCYCDSIWDAWPSEVNGQTGSGVLTVQASNSSTFSLGGNISPFAGGGQRQRGALAIKEITDGITRETPFVVPVIYRAN